MMFTRRNFGKLALAGLSSSVLAQTASKLNRSYFNGVQFGLQPFCYHDLGMNRENRPILIRRLVENGLGMVELHAVWYEPNFAAPGVSAEEAREKLRHWRLNPPTGYFRDIKKEFDDNGITICTVYINVGDSFTDAEIDATFEGAKAIGAKGIVGSYGLAVAHRLGAFPGKHGMYASLHNHDNLSDPDAFSNEASIVKGLAYSPDLTATLDVRHFTAGNGDCVGFLERHHQRVSAVHVGDRRKNNGRSAPFGEGDAPIIEILRLIRDNQWPIIALLEFEHGTLRTGVDEVQLMFDYCKRALA